MIKPDAMQYGFSRPNCSTLRINGSLSSVFANNKGADQAAHPRSLISAFVIRLLESIISKLATSKFSIFQLVSVAIKDTGLSFALSEILRVEAHMYM